MSKYREISATARVEVEGETLEQCIAKAEERFKRFFEGREFEITAVDAEPYLTGRALVDIMTRWRADVVAHVVGDSE